MVARPDEFITRSAKSPVSLLVDSVSLLLSHYYPLKSNRLIVRRTATLKPSYRSTVAFDVYAARRYAPMSVRNIVWTGSRVLLNTVFV